MDLFVYGTLLFPEVLIALLGRVPARQPASAVGWRVAALPGRPYPGLVPHPGGTALGQVISGLVESEARLLDDYEDGGYRLTAITLADGRSCPSYVWRAGVLAQDWSLDRFAADQLAGYVLECARWRVVAGWGPPPCDDR
ncbi:MAG TPA: gamma-glutamylcyclotransferase family protein [Pseudonocardiaceae bacterium]|jgi:gamma-glutamylcyclotransferase (GGCT)/AIG2-like uncharacterized protein YtfP